MALEAESTRVGELRPQQQEVEEGKTQNDRDLVLDMQAARRSGFDQSVNSYSDTTVEIANLGVAVGLKFCAKIF